MSEATVPKRRRPRPGPTAGGAASGSAAAGGVSSGSAAAAPLPAETEYSHRKRLIKVAKQHMLLAQIKSICACATVSDPGAALDEIEQLLEARTDSEDEAPASMRMTLPAEDVANCDQQ